MLLRKIKSNTRFNLTFVLAPLCASAKAQTQVKRKLHGHPTEVLGEKKLKNLLFRIYIIFDFIIFLSAIICPFIFFTNHLSFDVSFDFALLFFISLGLYISINSIIAIIWSKSTKENFDLQISDNWFLPMYIVNVLSVFCLLLPFFQTFHFLSEKNYTVFILCFLISLIILLSILGQVKWQKMILANQDSKRFIRNYLCILNPIKCFVIILQGFTLPDI